MKLLNLLITITLLAVLSGCGTTAATHTNVDGSIFSMETRTLFKNVKDVKGKASVEGFEFELGSSGDSLTPEQTQALGCVLNPASCGR